MFLNYGYFVVCIVLTKTVFRPDIITVMVGWALKINYLSICTARSQIELKDPISICRKRLGPHSR